MEVTASKLYSDTKNLIYENGNGKGAFAPRTGDIIKASVVKIDKAKATLYVNDKFSFEADTASLKGDIKLGDELAFKAECGRFGTFSLKQLVVSAKKQNQKQLSKDEMLELFKQQGMYHDDLKAEEYAENQKKAADAAAKVRRKLNGIAGNSTHKAINELIASGLSIEKINIDMLNTVMYETQKQTAIKGEPDTNDGKPRSAVKNNSYERETKTNHDEDYDAKRRGEYLTGVLKSNGLDDTRQNTSKLESVAAKWNEVKEVNDEAIMALLRTGSTLTLENIYKAKYSIFNLNKGQSASSGADSLGLDDEIGKFLSREGFALNEENTELSRLLVAGGVPLTADNLNKAVFLRGIGEYGIERILNLACENIKNGRQASDIEIFTAEQKETFASLMGEYNQTIEVLPEINANALEFALRGGTELTLRNLRGIDLSRKMPDDVSAGAISAKIRLTEIQYKLTTEAAMRLSHKNININTMPIQKALETLKQMERQEYEKGFKVIGAAASEDKLNEITDLFGKIKTFRPIASSVFGDIISKRVEFTVNGVGESVRLSLRESYEASQTKVSRKYGDSFSKVYGQFEDLLKKLAVSQTEDNIRAASILSRNGIDVDETNILRVKNIDAKINMLYDKLHPYIAVDMLENNMNPASMNIDDVLEYIDRFDGEYGSGVKDKAAQYIMEMDSANITSDTTRESVIAIYRMLSAIQGDGAASLGVSFKKDSQITLQGLFSDAKYFKRTKASKTDIDMLLGDDTEIKVRAAGENDTLSALSSAVSRDNESHSAAENEALVTEHINLMLKRIADKANPASLNAAIGQNPGFMDMPLEEAARFLEAAYIPDTEFLNARYGMLINDIQNIPPHVIHWLTENNIPPTMNNMNALTNMIKKPHYLSGKLNEARGKIPEGPDGGFLESSVSGGDLFENLTELQDKLSDILPRVTDVNFTPETAQSVNLIQNTAKIQDYIHQRPGNAYFQIPVRLHDKIGSVNMYLINKNIGENDALNLYLSLDTTNLGNVSMFISLSGGDAKMRICVPDKTALRRIESYADELVNTVSEIGFNVSKLTFEARDEINILENEVTCSAGSSSYEFNFAI